METERPFAFFNGAHGKWSKLDFVLYEWRSKNKPFSLWFQKITDVHRANFYVNIEKLVCFIDY